MWDAGDGGIHVGVAKNIFMQVLGDLVMSQIVMHEGMMQLLSACEDKEKHDDVIVLNT